MAWFTPPDSYQRKAALILALPPAGAFVAAATTTPTGWQRHDDGVRIKARVPTESPALALTPATLPPKVSGMAWFEPPDQPVYGKPRRDVVPSMWIPKNLGVPVGISGMAWFTPPDFKQPRQLERPQLPPSIALTPATLPPTVSGMAWFEPLDVYQPRRWYRQDAPAYGRPAITQLIGVPWANWLDVLPKAPPKQQPSMAAALVPSIAPTPISGMAWFAPADSYQQRRSYQTQPAWAPQVIAAAAATVPSGWWSNISEAVRRTAPQDTRIAFAFAPFAVPTIWTQPSADPPLRARVRPADVPTFVPPVRGAPPLWTQPFPELLLRARAFTPTAPAILLRPPAAAAVGIAGMAWFVPQVVMPRALSVNSASAAAWQPQDFVIPPSAVTVDWLVRTRRRGGR